MSALFLIENKTKQNKTRFLFPGYFSNSATQKQKEFFSW